MLLPLLELNRKKLVQNGPGVCWTRFLFEFRLRQKILYVNTKFCLSDRRWLLSAQFFFFNWSWKWTIRLLNRRTDRKINDVLWFRVSVMRDVWRQIRSTCRLNMFCGAEKWTWYGAAIKLIMINWVVSLFGEKKQQDTYSRKSQTHTYTRTYISTYVEHRALLEIVYVSSIV